MSEVAIFSLSGEVDVARRCELQQAFAELATRQVDVAVDCAQLTFMDSTGVNTLVELRNAVAATGHTMRLVNLNGPPRRVVEVLGLNDFFGLDA